MSKRLYTLNDNYFDQIDTEEKAYFLGLLFTDGCNYENEGRIKLDLTEEDIYILERMKESMQLNCDIKHYKEKVETIDGKKYECKPTCRLTFVSHHMSQKLAEYGMVSNKSTYGGYIKDGVIPDHLYNHWVRGLIDGDGGIAYWIDNPKTGHKKFQIYFCSTEDSVIKLAEYIGKRFECKPNIGDRHPDRDNNNLQFSLFGNLIVRSITDWIYQDATIYLKRKYDKYLELIGENDRKKNDKNVYGSAKQPRKVVHLETGIVYENMRLASEATGKTKPYICVHAKKKDKWMYYEDWCSANNIAK